MMTNLKPTTRNLKLYQSGFTLVEVMLSVSVFAILSGGIIGLIGVMTRDARKQDSLLSSTDQARKVAFQFENGLRDAVASNTGAYPLDTVAAQTVIFYSNIDSDPEIERVRYYLSAGKMYRGIVNPTGSPLTYNIGSEVSTVIQSNVANGSSALFHYYDENYAGTQAELAQPVSVVAVRHIKLELRVTNTGGLTSTNYFTVTAGASLRNLKTNLGD